MSKKMKGVALYSSPYGVYEDAKTRLKHQTLMQDYRELQKETEGQKNKLETMKQRKSTLLAEVRFLRQRYKYLLRNKSPKPLQKRELVQPQNLETKSRNIMKERIHSKKEDTLQNLAPVFDKKQKERIPSGKQAAVWNSTLVFDINQKERIHNGKEPSLWNHPIFDLNHKERIYGGNEAIIRNPGLPSDLNQKERGYGGKAAALQNLASAFDLNQKERAYGGKEAAVQNRTPVIDLNQISREEEELQDSFEPSRIEEPKKSLIRGDEQPNDLKLSICRNAGNGSNRVGKRKISWQDQVALRV
ncbi:hypothetical protein F0562_030380 [Nyssa sinensis]|uniref:Uncharacterized protein n=1 Tax=Nyssa sinensis TaxID=561372 RepID=A0A5J5B0U0_9ASTE|nr:hypothetical protein F0562_030380 [Nyssa sinensis]